MIRRRLTIRAAFALAIAVAAAPSARAEEITGSGSTLVAPIMAKWTELARAQANLTVSYTAMGSARGQNRVMAREVDFAISDNPVAAETRDTAGLAEFPLVVTGVVCVVNIPGVDSGKLRLTGDILADLYTGVIRKWNDERIVALNPGLKLPDLEIRPVLRNDVMGTTYVFTQFLLRSNAAFRERHGTHVTRRWAIGSQVTSNGVMGEVVRTLPGSIGYMDYSSALAGGYQLPQLRNSAGKFVAPSVAGFAAAVAAVDWSKGDMTVSLVDQRGDTAWPIVTPSYLLVPRAPRTPEAGKAVRQFVELAFAKGGTAAEEIQAVPLPQAAQDAVRAAWARLGGS